MSCSACRLALQAHHADDVLAAAGQALGGAVGHVAEFLAGAAGQKSVR